MSSKRLKTLLTSMFQLICAVVIAQNSYYEGGIEYKGTFWPLSKTLNYEEIEGSPYPSQNLVQGQVQFEGGDSKTYYMRYDMYLDEMEFLRNDQLYSITNSKILLYLDIGPTRYVYEDYFINNKKFTGYMVELIVGEYSLYRKDRVQFEPEKQPKSSYDSVTPPTFKSRPPLYLMAFKGGPIKQFNIDKSAYGKFTDLDELTIKSYMKEHKLKFKNQNDLMQLFQYLNSLQAKD